MAQENGTQEQVVAQPQQAQRLSIAESLGGLLNPKDRADLVATEQKIRDTPAPKAEGTKTPPAEEQKKEDPKVEEKKEAPKAEAPKAEEKKEEGKAEDKKDDEPKSKFGLGKKKGDELQIETPEQLIETISKQFGRSDIKDIKDTGKFFEQAKDWRTKAQGFEKIETELKETSDFLATLPESIIDSMKLFADGKDHTKPFQNMPTFDFNKPADKQDKMELVKHYFPNQYKKLSEDEVSDGTDGVYSDKLQAYVETALDKFNTQQQSIKNERAGRIDRANTFKRAFTESATGSVDYLKQSFPDMDRDTIKEVSNIVTGGMEEISKLFLNRDGTLKKEAAKNIMLAIHGEEEMKRLETIAARRAESKANEDIVTRGTDQQKAKKSGAGQGTPQQELSKEVAKQIADLGQGYGTKKTF